MGEITSTFDCSSCSTCTTTEEQKAKQQFLNSKSYPQKQPKKQQSHSTKTKENPKPKPKRKPSPITMSPETAKLLQNMDPIPTGTGTPIIDNDIAMETLIASINAHKTQHQEMHHPQDTQQDTDKTDTSSLRVKKLSSIIDKEALERAVNEQYDHIDDDDEDEEESSYSDDVKTSRPNTSLSVAGPKLYRDNTTSEWDEDDIDVLQNDMHQQLLALTDRLSNQNVKKTKHTKQQQDKPVINNLVSPSFKIMISGSDDDGTTQDIDRLYRDKSSDTWDTTEINQRKEEMRKEMVHLLKTQSDKRSSQ